MKKVLKKNSILITALAIMIAIAGYLNFAGRSVNGADIAAADSNSVASADDVVILNATSLFDEGNGDILSLDDPADGPAITDLLSADGLEVDADAGAEAELSDLTAQENPAVPTETPGEAIFVNGDTVGSLAGARLLKEQTRAKNKETLLEIINNSNIDNTQKQVAIDNMVNMTEIAEMETATEILLESKGFAGAVVSISGTYADVMVSGYQLSEPELAQIEDIVVRKTQINPANIIITPIAVD